MQVNKILFVTLSNIGDCILTLPALDALQVRFPKGEITVLAGPRPKEIFQDNPRINRLIIYDKHSSLKEKIGLFRELKKEKFDLVVDLRNSLLGVLLPARKKTSSLSVIPKNIKHTKDRHLYKIPNPKSQIPNKIPKISLYIKPEDEEYINRICKEKRSY